MSMANSDRPSRFSRLSFDEAWERFEAYEAQYGEGHALLACHAAFPMIVSSELVNLIHINFLDDAGIPWMAEPDFLLSTLCKRLGNGLYQVDPVMRQVLQIELPGFVKDAQARLDRLANFLLVYSDHTRGRSQRPEVLRAHRWIAYAYRQPQRVLDEMVALLTRDVPQEAGYTAAGTPLAQQLQVATLLEVVRDPIEARLTETMRTTFEQLLETSAVIAHYWYRDAEAAESLLNRAEDNPLLAHVVANLGGTTQKEEAITPGLTVDTPPPSEIELSKPIPQPGSPIDSEILDGQLFVDRVALRHALAALFEEAGQKILIVNGPPGSGKSYTYVLIRFVENKTGLFRSIYIDFAELPYSGLYPDDSVRQIAYAMGWDLSTMPQQIGLEARWVNELATWVVGQTSNMAVPLWIVLDGADQVQLPVATHDFIWKLAENIDMRRLNMRLVLLGYSGTLPRLLQMHIIHIELVPLTRQEVYTFLKQWTSAQGIQNDETLGLSANLISDALEQDQGSLHRLSSLLRVVLEQLRDNKEGA